MSGHGRNRGAKTKRARRRSRPRSHGGIALHAGFTERDLARIRARLKRARRKQQEEGQ